MLLKLFFAGGLVVLTVAMHALGFSALLRTIVRWHVLERSGFRPVTGMVIVLTCWLILIHVAEICLWGVFYCWQGCLPDAESSFYFSAVTYTTLGYGDLVLPRSWRMLAPLEALTGILMCGVSTGLFFALVTRWFSNWIQKKTTAEVQTDSQIKNRNKVL